MIFQHSMVRFFLSKNEDSNQRTTFCDVSRMIFVLTVCIMSLKLKKIKLFSSWSTLICVKKLTIVDDHLQVWKRMKGYLQYFKKGVSNFNCKNWIKKIIKLIKSNFKRNQKWVYCVKSIWLSWKQIISNILFSISISILKIIFYFFFFRSNIVKD